MKIFQSKAQGRVIHHSWINKSSVSKLQRTLLYSSVSLWRCFSLGLWALHSLLKLDSCSEGLILSRFLLICDFVKDICCFLLRKWKHPADLLFSGSFKDIDAQILGLQEHVPMGCWIRASWWDWVCAPQVRIWAWAAMQVCYSYRDQTPVKQTIRLWMSAEHIMK